MPVEKRNAALITLLSKTFFIETLRVRPLPLIRRTIKGSCRLRVCIVVSYKVSDTDWKLTISDNGAGKPDLSAVEKKAAWAPVLSNRWRSSLMLAWRPSAIPTAQRSRLRTQHSKPNRSRRPKLNHKRHRLYVGYWHKADIRGTATICPLSDNSGQRWNLAGDGLSAFDPTATMAAHCGNSLDAGFSLYQSTHLSR